MDWWFFPCPYGSDEEVAQPYLGGSIDGSDTHVGHYYRSDCVSTTNFCII